MTRWLKAIVAPFYSAIHTLPKIACTVSYYPECPRKCFIRRYFELVINRFLTRSTNLFYNAYGMDLKIGKKENYISEREFWSKIVAKNYPNKVNHAIILRDKALFATFMKEYKISTPEIIAFSAYGKFYWGEEAKQLSFLEWVTNLTIIQESIFLKDASSCCAKGVIKVSPREWNLNEEYFTGKKIIIQRAIKNCEQLDAIQPNSLNTLRIVTINSPKTGEIELLSPGGLRVGGGSDVDNWAAGGLFVGLDNQGRLQKYGFYKPGKHVPCKADSSPQTNFKFEGYQLPYYRDATALVKKAHSFLPEVPSIGWDVALTPIGPTIIEGNDDYEVSLMQIVAGGLRSRFIELGLL